MFTHILKTPTATSIYVYRLTAEGKTADEKLDMIKELMRKLVIFYDSGYDRFQSCYITRIDYYPDKNDYIDVYFFISSTYTSSSTGATDHDVYIFSPFETEGILIGSM